MNRAARVMPTTVPPTDILDGLATGVIVLDDAGIVTAANAAAERVLQTTRSQIVGRSLGVALRDAEALDQLIERVREESAALVMRDFAIHPINSSDATNTIDVVATLSAPGTVLLELQDNTMHLQIQRENRLMEQHGVGRTIARQLAHEIKNPLGGLRGAAQLLARRLSDAKLRQFTDVIIRESDRLVALVDTMLGPARPIQPKPINIHKLLQHVARLVAAESGPGVDIIEDYDPSLPEIRLDEDGVIQALLNVVRNALQAIDGNGTITLRTRAVNGFTIAERRHPLVLRIDVSDTGPGIDPSVEDRLFFPLVTSRAQGTGLGLSLAQELVARHDGLIKITGHSPTVFSIYLPYLRERAVHGDTRL